MEWATSFNGQFAASLNSTFKLPYMTLIDLRFIMTKELHISLTEFDSLPFFEILLILDKYKNWIDDQNKSNQEQNDKYNAEMERVRANTPDYNRMAQQNMPKMPSMPNMNMPNFSMPNFPK